MVQSQNEITDTQMDVTLAETSLFSFSCWPTAITRHKEGIVNSLLHYCRDCLKNKDEAIINWMPRNALFSTTTKGERTSRSIL